MVSILMLTIDRYDVLVDCLEHNLKHIGCDYELLVCDNGSKDERVIEYIRSKKPKYFRINSTNMGVAPMQNDLLKNAKGDYLCFMGNDIKMPMYWGKNITQAIQVFPDAGLVSYYCVGDKGSQVESNGIKAYTQWNCFGTAIMGRHVFYKVGYLCNRYAPYGLEDSDYHFRLNHLGFRQYYLHGATCEHLGEDAHQKHNYREMKWESLRKNQVIYGEQTELYKATNNFYLPFDQ